MKPSVTKENGVYAIEKDGVRYGFVGRFSTGWAWRHVRMGGGQGYAETRSDAIEQLMAVKIEHEFFPFPPKDTK